MTSLAPSDVLNYLAHHQFLTGTQVELMEREGAGALPPELALEQMVGRGWLTHFQMKTILAGEADRLVFGPYRLQKPLGEGGMGVVYLAHQPKLDRQVALKVIRPQILAAKPDIVQRFHREAKAIARVTHPNVIVLYDADDINGIPFIAMEYIEGLSLEGMVRMNGPLAIRQACDYVCQAAVGLQHAHECGLVHRDIKPSNLLVARKPTGGQTGGRKGPSGQFTRPVLVTQRDRDLAVDGDTGRLGAWGTVKLLDLGLARLVDSFDDGHGETPLTRAGVLLGTPDFIAPEQARDARTADTRADIYSLGCTFYYLLTGRVPFAGGTDVQKLLRHQSERAPSLDELRPHVPPAVASVVERMMQKRPDQRYQQPKQLAEELARYLEGPSTPLPGTVALMHIEAPATDPHAPTALPEALPASNQNETPHDFPAVASLAAATPPEVKGSNGLPSAKLIGEVHAHRGVVNTLAISPDNLHVASGGVDAKVVLHNFNGEGPVRLGRLPRPATEVQALAFSPTEPMLVVGGTQQRNARIWRWDYDENRVFDWGCFNEEKRGVGTLRFDAEGKTFAAGIGPLICIWKLSGRDARSRSILKGHVNGVRAIDFSPDRRLMVSGSDGQRFRLWSFGWLGASMKAHMDGHTDAVSAVSFSPTGKRLVTGGMDGNAILWDPLFPSLDTAVTLRVGGSIRIARILPDGRHLITVTVEGAVALWDIGSATRLQVCAIESFPASLALSPDGHFLAAGTSDGTVRFYSLEQLFPPQPPAPMHFSSGH